MEDQIMHLSEFFKILSDPTRLRILNTLRIPQTCADIGKGCRVCDGDGAEGHCVHAIARDLDMTQTAVSHQLRHLKTARLVRSKRVGKHIFYSFCDEHVNQIIEMGFSHVLE